MIAGAFFALSGLVRSQDIEKGRSEFLSNCATCHGADGKGVGPLSATLKTKPANLTTLAKNNNGVFSPSAVYKMIDGREAIRTHRSTEMPIWGCRHARPAVWPKNAHKRKHRTQHVSQAKVHAPTIESFFDLSCDPEPVIKDRILSIVEYLSYIQEK